MKFVLPNLSTITNFDEDVIKWSNKNYKIEYVSIQSIWVLENMINEMVQKPLIESNHFKYLNGNKQPYFDMVKRCNFELNYHLIFEKLIANFSYLQKGYEKDYIITYQDNEKYIILDGCHRASLLKQQGYTIIPVVIVEF
jgi:hypothetical protein